MIVYQKIKSSFIADVHGHDIEEIIADAYVQKTGHYAPNAEVRAWRESLTQMAKVLNHEDIPNDAGVGIGIRDSAIVEAHRFDTVRQIRFERTKTDHR